MFKLPQQRLPYKEKRQDEDQWAKDTVDYIITRHIVDRGAVNDYQSDYERKISNYQLFNNILNQMDFEKECNPLGIEVGQFQDEIKPYNKSYNKIQVLLSEELKRPFNYRAVLTDSDSIKQKNVKRSFLLRQYMEAQAELYVAQAKEALASNAQQAQDAQEEQQMIQAKLDSIVPPDQIDKFMSTNYLDSKEITANKILNYLEKYLDLKDKKNDSYKHGLLSGDEVVWVGEENGSPVVRNINSVGAFWHKSSEEKWVQKGFYAGFQTYMTLS